MKTNQALNKSYIDALRSR